jgi:hypothetical protein
MLTISAETYTKFQEFEERRFIKRVSDFLRNSVPGLAAEPEPQMLATIRQLQDQADTYGMINEQAVASYALTAAHLGVDFVERFRGIRQILFLDRSQDEKAALLESFTVKLLQTPARH